MRLLPWLFSQIVVSSVFASGLAIDLTTDLTTDFVSPNQVLETCRLIPKLAHAKYKSKDSQKEAELCGINFYNNQLRLCPKSWSTSPSTLILSQEQVPFSVETCTNKKTMEPYHKEAKFKVSMNEQGTSGTFSSASVLYYHLSRYLNVSIDVPVAVYRTMDKKSHYKMVSSKVINFENEMIKTAWDYLRKAESQSVNVLNPANETFTSDGLKIFGSLIESVGNAKYGEHIRGLKTNWGEAQHSEIKKTPAFVALSQTAPVIQAAQQALLATASNFPKELVQGDLPSSQQMMLWMQEMSDMSILDHILKQQDRPGNIHFQWRILYSENGQLKSKRLKLEDKYSHYTDYAVIKKIALEQYKALCQASPCYVVQKSIIEDNDAAGRIYYNDFFRRAKIVDSLRHLNPETYVRLQNLAYDFKKQGEAYQYFKTYFNIDSPQFSQLVKNTIEAAQTLSNNCKLMRFDLDYEKYMLTGQVSQMNGLCN